jgi:hypothetical protein
VKDILTNFIECFDFSLEGVFGDEDILDIAATSHAAAKTLVSRRY